MAEIDLTSIPTAGALDLHDPRQRSEVEVAVTEIPGVRGARLVPGFDRQVDELHVLTTVDRSAKQTVRDVQTVLMARFGISTDHRVISVAQLEERQGRPALRGRPVIAEVGVVRTGTMLEACVVLQDRSATHRGVASGAATPGGRRRAVAQATLRAIAPLLGGSASLELEAVENVDLAGRSLVTVVVEFRAGRRQLGLAGAALVHDTTDDAVTCAVLDALNRIVTDAQR